MMLSSAFASGIDCSVVQPIMDSAITPIRMHFSCIVAL